ncbi:2018_t:CDS:2 [Entrophospora sp. SA101]|nr:2018_t:CDS:2 [Entrophospora sp. SA101]
MFTTIGYGDQESTGPCSHPDFQKEAQCFCVELRKKDHLNPIKSKFIFESLDGGNRLKDIFNLSIFNIGHELGKGQYRHDCLPREKTSKYIIALKMGNVELKLQGNLR